MKQICIFRTVYVRDGNQNFTKIQFKEKMKSF